MKRILILVLDALVFAAMAAVLYLNWLAAEGLL